MPDITTSEDLTERLMRWEPETAVVAPEGVELAAFQVPGSPGQMAATVEALARSRAVVWARHGIVTRSDVFAVQAADLAEYFEAAATYEVMNLSAGSPAGGLEEHERQAVPRRCSPTPVPPAASSSAAAAPSCGARRPSRCASGSAAREPRIRQAMALEGRVDVDAPSLYRVILDGPTLGTQTCLDIIVAACRARLPDRPTVSPSAGAAGS